MAASLGQMNVRVLTTCMGFFYGYTGLFRDLNARVQPAEGTKDKSLRVWGCRTLGYARSPCDDTPFRMFAGNLWFVLV